MWRAASNSNYILQIGKFNARHASEEPKEKKARTITCWYIVFLFRLLCSVEATLITFWGKITVKKLGKNLKVKQYTEQLGDKLSV